MPTKKVSLYGETVVRDEHFQYALYSHGNAVCRSDPGVSSLYPFVCLHGYILLAQSDI